MKMNVTVTERKVKSSDNIHLLYGKVYVPDCEIKGYFHLVHGMTEHGGRYDSFLRSIAQNGYICFAYDHLGHGRTVNDESELGFIAESGGWKLLVDDVKIFADSVRAEYGDYEYNLFGHSMGSFIVRLNAEKYSEDIKRLIICGTSGPIAAAPFGLMIIKLLKKIKGSKAYSPFCENLAFGSYLKRTEKLTKYDWLTTDREIIKMYAEDKLCNFHFTLSALYDLVKLNFECNKKRWYKNVADKFPMLLISGEEDPVGNYGKGIKKVKALLSKYGASNVKMILYPKCRHEIHHDSCKDKMLTNVLEFLN